LSSGDGHEPRRTVLVISGEARLPRLVKVALEPGHFQVVSARSREEALDLVAVHEPTLVVLEMEQADGDGVAVCRSLRELSDVPVIFLAAADDDATKVRALRCADDYVTRPFSVVELLARVEAILRRARPCLGPRETAYDDGLLAVDLSSHQVTFGGVAVTLTPTELKLLALLVENRNRVLLHEEILSQVWGEAYRDDHHLLRLHVANLRKKIEPDPATPRYVKTQRGLGYVFSPDAREVAQTTAG
jgi:two-component system, OmpR family, KDP operon response regulator KdpE